MTGLAIREREVLVLQGVRVVELATMVAAPSAVGLLADWGAQVVKIEPHAGDPMRARPGSPLGSINFDLHNRGKRSIALDTNAPDTREVILRLVRQADVFVTNMLPAQLAKLSLTYADLHPENPRMVYGAISSFGRRGPDKDRGATDNLGFWARGGGTGLLTVEGQEPVPIRQSVGDRITGMTACAGILAALTQAQRTGVGPFVDTSLLASGLWSFATDVSNQLNKGRVAPSRDRHGAVLALANYFKTRDGRWLQIMGDPVSLGAALDAPWLATDPRVAEGSAREKNAAMVTLVDGLFAQFDYDDVKARLEAAGVRAEPVATMAEVAADPQAIAAARFVQAPNEGGLGVHWQVANPWTVGEDGEPAPAPGPPPALGQHTLEILRELGFGDPDLARMRGNKTILCGAQGPP